MPPVYATALEADLCEVVRFYLADSFDRDADAKPAPLGAVLGHSHGVWIAATLAAAAWIVLRARWM
jgi:hypothetical protein